MDYTHILEVEIAMIETSLETSRITMYPDGRLNTKNAACYLGLSEKTLAMMRCSGTGPVYVKRGRVFYYKDDLDDWLVDGKVQSTAQAAI